MSGIDFLLSSINTIDGVGKKTSNLLKKKNINTVFDILWSIPRNTTDRSNLVKINQLKIGTIQTITVNVIKYNFPRIRRLPNKVNCEDETGKLDCIFFNSYEGYIKKILPLNTQVTISGKIGYYNKKYQITNPTYISNDVNQVKKIFSNYNLTEGLGEKKYKKIISKILTEIPELDEWLSDEMQKKFEHISWRKAILELHNPKNVKKDGNYLDRLIFDEIMSTFLINSKIRKTVKKLKKIKKNFDDGPMNKIQKSLNFNLTNDQLEAIEDIGKDLKSNQKMFRLLQGDVGSGKTLVALISSYNVIYSGFQVALMAPTEILANQHFNLAKKIFDEKINCSLLTSNTSYKERKKIIDDLENQRIDILFGTHSLFQDKIKFKKLGLIVIDEQHKFGVKQRKRLSDKGGKDCDVLVMSATPIPRTMTMTIFGDMDTSIIKNKPKYRKSVITYSKPENKLNEIISFTIKQIKNGGQIFWVCPLIEESKKLDHQSSIKRYEYLKKFFKNKIGLLHGLMDKEDKEIILNDFLNKKIDIIVSTTVIEVGIDFPNANVIVIENANKFGLSQLHQLRGRVGRGLRDSYCILMFKSQLSKNAIKRIKILKENDDGFFIAEEDLKMRGFGDLTGYQQSGIKNYRFADPLQHADLFNLAEKYILEEELNLSQKKYDFLLKLFDKAEIINLVDN